MPRYALASALSFFFIIGTTAALHEVFGVSETLSPAIAMVAALVVNFTLLRVWVFPGQTVHWGRQFAQTVVTSATFRGLEYAIFLALHLGLNVNYLLATGVSVCVSALGKFGVYRQIVFKREPAAPAADPASSSA
jgi:putative flippase GtrA